MASHELFGETLDDVAKLEGPLLLRHAGMEDHLEEEVTQFIAQVVEIAPRNGVGHLVSLLDGVRRDRVKGLLQVPGTAGAGRAQRRHDLEQPGDVARRGHHKDRRQGQTADHIVLAAICPAPLPSVLSGGRGRVKGPAGLPSGIAASGPTARPGGWLRTGTSSAFRLRRWNSPKGWRWPRPRACRRPRGPRACGGSGPCYRS